MERGGGGVVYEPVWLVVARGVTRMGRCVR